MSTLTNQELFVIRNNKNNDLISGYGRYSTPMLYSKPAAYSVAGKMNKKWNCKDYEVIPVQLSEKK